MQTGQLYGWLAVLGSVQTVKNTESLFFSFNSTFLDQSKIFFEESINFILTWLYLTVRECCLYDREVTVGYTNPWCVNLKENTFKIGTDIISKCIARKWDKASKARLCPIWYSLHIYNVHTESHKLDSWKMTRGQSYKSFRCSLCQNWCNSC